MHLKRLFATSAVLAASIVGFGAAPAANAAPPCEQVYMSGYGAIILPTDETECLTTMDTGFCDDKREAVEPLFYVYTEVCLPAPVTAP